MSRQDTSCVCCRKSLRSPDLNRYTFVYRTVALIRDRPFLLLYLIGE